MIEEVCKSGTCLESIVKAQLVVWCQTAHVPVALSGTGIRVAEVGIKMTCFGDVCNLHAENLDEHQ